MLQHVYQATGAEQLLDLPSEVALVLIGDAGDFSLQAVFEADIEVLKAKLNAKVSAAAFSTRPQCLFGVSPPAGVVDVMNGKLEFIVVNNVDIDVVAKVFAKFVNSPYLNRTLLYGGHGDENGNLFFLPSNVDGRCMLDFKSYFGRAINRSLVPGLTGEFILNCCSSHRMVGNDHHLAMDNGLRIYPTTTNADPYLPAGGIAELTSRDTNVGRRLLERFPFLAGLWQAQATAIAEQRRKLTATDCDKAKFRTQFAITTALDVGLYVFPAERGDTYLLRHDGFTMLFDSGYDWQTFAAHVWNPFSSKIAQLDAVVVSHIDQDHLCGVFKLFHTSNLNAAPYYPKVSSLWINAPDAVTGEATRSAGDGRAIILKANEKLITIKRSLTTNATPIYQSGDLKIFVVTPSVGLREEMLRKTFSEYRSDRSISNRAAISLLIEVGKWSALLCSDVPQRDITDGLKVCKPSAGNAWTFDVVSVPHHGRKMSTAISLMSFERSITLCRLTLESTVIQTRSLSPV